MHTLQRFDYKGFDISTRWTRADAPRGGSTFQASYTVLPKSREGQWQRFLNLKFDTFEHATAYALDEARRSIDSGDEESVW